MILGETIVEGSERIIGISKTSTRAYLCGIYSVGHVRKRDEKDASNGKKPRSNRLKFVSIDKGRISGEQLSKMAKMHEEIKAKYNVMRNTELSEFPNLETDSTIWI